jgi:PAS domain S-box-containing protein
MIKFVYFAKMNITRNKTYKYIVPVFFILFIFFFAIGYVYKQTVILQSKDTAYNQLVSITRLKADQFTDWYIDELLDAKIISQHYGLTSGIGKLLNGDQKSTDLVLMKRWFETTKRTHDLADILLISLEREIMHSANNLEEYPEPEVLDAIEESYINKDVVSTDFYCNSEDKRILIDFVCPVYSNEQELLAFISLSVNPQSFLFPQIEKWPVESKTAEVLLVHHKGNEVVVLNWPCVNNETQAYLNEADLKISRVSKKSDTETISLTDLINSSEKKHVFFSENIQGTEWNIISKIEKEELFGEIRKRALFFYLFLFSALIALIFALSFIYIISKKQYENKQQKAINEQRRQLLTLLSNLPGMAYRCKNDKLWTMEFVSEGCYGLTGYKPVEIINNRDVAYGNIIFHEDQKLVLEEISKALQNKRNYEFEYRIITKNFENKWVWERGCGVYDKNGDLLALEGFISDISVQVEAKEQLKYNINLLNTIIENIPDAVYLKDIKGRKLVANKADLENIGIDNKEKVMGKSDFDIFPKEIAEAFWKNDQKVLKSGAPIINKLEKLTNKSGLTKWLHTSKIPFEDEKGKIIGLVGIGHDVTEKINLMNELVEAKEKAEESDRLKTSFLANMSHEIRTPLNSILGFTDILTQASDLENIEKENYSGIVKKSADSLLQIINDIIDISSLETGQMKITVSQFNINELLDLLYSEFSKRITSGTGSNIKLKLLRADPDIELELDKNRLNQVFINLLTNALKFTDVGFIEFGITSYDEENIHFKVDDSGIGIAPEMRTLIFERFRQGADTAVRSKGGNGLGLSIVKNLVELMGGEIWVEPGKEKGSCFRFYLKRKVNFNN